MPNKKKAKAASASTSLRGVSGLMPSSSMGNFTWNRVTEQKTPFAAMEDKIGALNVSDTVDNKSEPEKTFGFKKPSYRTMPSSTALSQDTVDCAMSSDDEQGYKQSGPNHTAQKPQQEVLLMERSNKKGKEGVSKSLRNPSTSHQPYHSGPTNDNYLPIRRTLTSVAIKIHEPSLLFNSTTSNNAKKIRYVIKASARDFPTIPFAFEFTTDHFAGNDIMACKDWLEFLYDIVVHLANSQLPQAQFQDLIYLCANSIEHASTLAWFFKDTVSVGLDGNPQLQELEKIAGMLGRLIKTCYDGFFDGNATLYGLRYLTRKSGVNEERNYSLEKERNVVCRSEREHVERMVQRLIGDIS